MRRIYKHQEKLLIIIGMTDTRHSKASEPVIPLESGVLIIPISIGSLP
jgi:nicotinamide mononucleotide adenylyltransferase